jgi:hypothetical protein
MPPVRRALLLLAVIVADVGEPDNFGSRLATVE